VEGGKRLAVMVSPMLTCEDAWLLGMFARSIDPSAVLAVGPIPRRGEDRSYPPGAAADKAYHTYAEKAPNARGVRRALEALGGGVLAYEKFVEQLKVSQKRDEVGAVILTGNYPDANWADEALLGTLNRAASNRKFVVLIDTLGGRLVDHADVILPAATWAEKAGTFENARGLLQAFDAAVPCLEASRPEAQIALELMHAERGAHRALSGDTFIAKVHGATHGTGSIPGIQGVRGAGGEDDQSEGGPLSDDLVQVMQTVYNAGAVRARMAKAPGLKMFGDVKMPEAGTPVERGMEVVEL
jgi:anaerobic selenocysteine-containing dehydrogenase